MVAARSGYDEVPVSDLRVLGLKRLLLDFIQRRMSRACIIFNPVAGRRCNRQRIEDLARRLVEQSQVEVVVQPTQGPASAPTLARRAAEDGFDVVVAAGGDGTVHEVASGLLDSGREEVTFLVHPVGSANDYSHSLLREHGDVVRWPNPGARVDVGRVTGLRGQPAWFLNSIGLGFSAMVTIESRAIRRLRGTLLYGLATLQAMRKHFGWQQWRVSVDDGPWEERSILMLSVMNGRREGNFVLAPEARLSDGSFDYVMAGQLSRWDIVKLLPSLASSGPPASYRHVDVGSCRKLVIESTTPIAAHVDGEILARPADVRFSAEVELVRERMQVGVVECGRGDGSVL